MRTRTTLVLWPLLVWGLAACGAADNGNDVASAGTGATSASAVAGPRDEEAAALEYAKCMRDNGLPGFPDSDENGGIKIDGTPGMDPMSPDYRSVEQTCAQRHLPDGGGTRSEKQESGR
ncbi:hypothetical protein [Umezawaea tangerina]|uniref:Lipoprotein n=1 Tax=Umezawaea tangerina TaxID=84725 RepID=A0A2T0SGC6_9PSEU|nr:hypothetical protein [Umezawaea tangerina]PRY32455.1 hypothetical protein CLV43_12149 [Umezawaea tangerina]